MLRNNYNITLEDYFDLLDAWAKISDEEKNELKILAEKRKAHSTIYTPIEEYIEEDREWLKDPRGDMFISLTVRC